MQVSTADGAEIGQDEFVRFEKIAGSPGNDVFILHDLGDWELDGGAGVDIVRIDGALDLTAASGGPFVYNIEVLDLNQDFANAIQLDAADAVTADPNGPLRILGGSTDVINFTSTYQVGGTGPQHIGTWQLVGTFVDPTADNSEGDPFNDHVTDGVTFDVYEFVSEGQVVATVYIQDGVQIDVTPGQTNAVNDTAATTENQSITVDVLANDAPGFDTTRTLTGLGSVSVTGPDGVSLGSPQVQIVNNQLSVVPGTAFDALAEGQTATITVPYTMQIGSGQTLNAVATITVTGTNDAPTDLALSANTVAENSANGTVVGQLSAVDPDASDTATYTLVDDAGGRFAIDGSNIVVAGSLDYETATSHQVTVRVTDGGGNTYDETFTVNVGNVSGNFTGTSAGESADRNLRGGYDPGARRQRHAAGPGRRRHAQRRRRQRQGGLYRCHRRDHGQSGGRHGEWGRRRDRHPALGGEHHRQRFCRQLQCGGLQRFQHQCRIERHRSIRFEGMGGNDTITGNGSHPALLYRRSGRRDGGPYRRHGSRHRSGRCRRCRHRHLHGCDRPAWL